MEASEDAKPKYKRASTPKVRTGCITWIAAARFDISNAMKVVLTAVGVSVME
ncbi:hypothetical protein BFJ70_g7859 [Fusarium oxysporum]|nr:hypothetical protein BFJ70_g7859 [Fusarium oxysporum]